MKPSLRGATHFAPAYPAAYVLTRLARVTLVLALIFAATLPSSAGDRRRPQRAVGSVFGWGNDFSYGSPTQLSGLSGVVAVADGSHSLILKSNGTVLARGWNDYGQLGDGTITSGTPVLTPVQVSGLSDVLAIAVGQFHSISLKSDGTVWTWGRNNYGQLGVVGGDQSTPVQVPSLSGVVAIAAGERHSLALKNDGTVWAWGSNGYGQLGVSGGSSVTPVQVTAPSGMSGMVAITAGNWHSVALSSDGTVWAWGYNYDGQLGMGGVGDGITYPFSTSTPQHAASGSFSGVIKISSLQYNILALKSDGTVWAWGRNDYGQLGNGGTSASGTPVQAAGLAGIVDVAAGYIHSVALKSDGTVLTWGYNGYGQLGNGTRDGNPHSTATQVPGLSGVVAISAGVFSSLALQSQAIGAAWGDNSYGQVGDGSTDLYVYAPRQVSNLSGLAAIASGLWHNLARLSDGSLWTWGYNNGGLGNGTTSSTTPVQLASFAGTVAAIAAGNAHSVVLKSDGTVWVWGFNSGTTPELQSDLSGTVALAAGQNHSLALRNDGTVWAFGHNNEGQLGNGSVMESSKPVQVIDRTDVSGYLTGVVAVAAGFQCSLVLKSDGTVWAWGSNGYGQLGVSGGSSVTPVQVTALSGMAAIAAGDGYSLALKSDGTVWVWGRNDLYQLGNGTTTDSPTPIQVSGLLAVAAIATSSSAAHTLALKGDGTLWGWGFNGDGQLGYGVSGRTPTRLDGPWATSAIAAGGFHSLTMALSLTAPPTLIVTAYDQVMTYGGTVPALTYTSGVTPLNTAPTCITSANSTSPVGTYTITCSGAAKAGYEIAYVPGTLTVNPAPLTITARDGWKTYGMTLVWVLDAYWPGSYITVNGLLNGDTVTDISLTTAGAPAAATLGTYPIIPSAAVGLGLTNYNITYAPGTLTVTAPAGALIVTPESQVMTYGGAVPPLTYTVTGLPEGQTLNTGATCVVPNMGAPPVGTSPITCSGAAKAGYPVAYGAATLTVNPAPLTIIADNKSMGAGSVVPELTASYFGLVNGDTPATLASYLLFQTTANSRSDAGTYPITVTVFRDTVNYVVTTVPGTLTVNRDLLTFNNNYFVTGDFAVGWVSLRGQGGAGGFATGAISIPNVGSSDLANTVPAGADIVAAYLYWQAVEYDRSAPAANGFFRDYPITGQQLGSDLFFTPSPAPPPLPGGGSTVMRMYRANVLPYLPLDQDGRRLPVGPHTVTLPDGGTGSLLKLPLNSGASLVVIYRVLSKGFPLKAVVLYDGAWVKPDGMQLTIRGFYDANGQAARGFNMASTASAFTPGLLTLPPPEGPPGQYSLAFQATDGTAGGMHIFSIAVKDSDGDGLLDAWEAGPPAGDPHAGEPGYYEVSDGSWVPLPGAAHGQKDMFVQLDYMCKAVNDNGTCDPANSRLPGQDVLLMVQQAFAASGITLHFVIGHAIQEETCTDDLSANPPRRCQFPGEPGVVGWKTGLEVFKVWARDPAACVLGNADGCRPRFERGQKDSYHYVLFGESLAVAAWNTRARTLESIVISNGVATITTPPRAPPNVNSCPTRVTISGALGVPELNGVYDVPEASCRSNTSFTIATPGVGNWTYTKPSSPADEREPLLAVISGHISSISGYSDLGGADSAVTLGKWAPNESQPQNTKANVQAGTLMHELGHTIGLAHGGAYQDTAGSYALTFDANCKPNYQSIMNYMFQIDLLPGHVLAFSGQALDTMNESTGSVAWTLNPAYSPTSWYVPTTDSSIAATRHCDGTPILDGGKMVRENQNIGIATPLTWTSGQDINFDGQVNAALRGYDDLQNIDLRQVGATGAEYVSMAGLLGFGSGGTLTMGSGGTLSMGSGGTLTMGSGGTLAMGSGGTLTMGSGGTLTFGSGGTITFGSGGTFTLGSGGTVVFGSGGGTLTMGSGGLLTMGSGGTLTMGSGGLFTMGSGGTLALGSGGTLTFGSGGGSISDVGTFSEGGTYALGSGGTLAMGSGGTLMLGSGGLLTMGSGGTLTMGSGSLLTMGSGGVFTMGSGGTLTMGSGGLLTMGSGGLLTMGSGGVFTMGSGGLLTMGSGGLLTMGSGGVFTMGSGGTLTMGSGGTLALGSGGTLALGSGGTLALGSGGTLALGSGGTFALGSGGVMEEMTYETANSVVRPPSGVTMTPTTGGGLRIDWEAPSFGVVSAYTVYYRLGAGTPVPVATVSGDPPQTTFTVTNPVANAVYFVTTTVAADSESTTPRSSPPSGPAVLKYDQTITLGALPDKLVGDQPFTISATASSNLPVSFSAAGNCTVTGNTVTLVGAGSCTITAWQPGDQQYNPAPSVPRTFAILIQRPQTISFSALPNKTYGDPDFRVRATASSGLPVSFSGAGNCTVTGQTVHLTGPGSCTVTASQGGNSVYEAAQPVARTFNIAKAAQTIAFCALPNKTYGDPDFRVRATASSGLPVSFSGAGNCTVTGQTVHLTGPGSCTVTASQGGNSVYEAAQPVAQTFNIAKAAQSITFAALANRIFSEVPFTVSATASSGLGVTFGGSDNCSVTPGGTVTMQHYGTCTVTAMQRGNFNYQPAPDVSRTFTIIAWTIQGFYSPVSMPQKGTPVWNVVKGGSTVSLKFNIYAGRVERTDLSAVSGGSVALYTVSCLPGNDTALAAVLDNAGSTSLQYDGTQFVQNWKTPKNAGTCYAVRMTVRDGSTITGYFRTK